MPLGVLGSKFNVSLGHHRRSKASVEDLVKPENFQKARRPMGFNSTTPVKRPLECTSSTLVGTPSKRARSQTFCQSHNQISQSATTRARSVSHPVRKHVVAPPSPTSKIAFNALKSSKDVTCVVLPPDPDDTRGSLTILPVEERKQHQRIHALTSATIV